MPQRSVARFIDGAWQFNGRKLTTLQALQWPRVEAPDYDTGEDFASNALPADLVKATCEMAREAILLDRAAARTDEGLLQLTITGALHLLFDKKDSRGILTDFAKLLLSRLGYSKQSGTGSRPILRV